MAAALMLRGGQAGSLKTMLLEARVFRGFASTVSLCADSGKNEKGHSLNPKKQSPPKNVVEPKERVKLPNTQTAAALSKSLSPPSSPPPVGNKGRTLARPHPRGSPNHEGPLQHLSRKTLVEFPRKILPPFQEQGSDSKVHQVSGNRRDDSSSSSSTSSSSDSESDEEEDLPEVSPRGVSKGKERFPKPEAIRSFEKKEPNAMATKAWRPPADVTHPGQRCLPKTTGPSSKSVEDRKEARPKPTTPSSQANEEILKKNVKKEELQKIFRSNEIDEESRKPFGVKDIFPDHTKAGSSTLQSGGPAFTEQTEEARVGGQLPAAALGAQGKCLEPQVPGLVWKDTSPLVREESLGKQVMEGHSKAKGGILEDEVPVRTVEKADADEKAAGPQPEEKGEAAKDAAPCVEAQGHTQESTQAPVPPEPADATTYKNLQHHNYNMYTFLDLNLDLSKFRMPQPSSGRESPRH